MCNAELGHTLLEVARNARHLGAEIGFFSVLHTWNQRLLFHPHVHCVRAAGGLAPALLQLRVLRFCMFVDGNVRVGVFPEGEKGLVSRKRADAGGVGVSAL